MRGGPLLSLWALCLLGCHDEPSLLVVQLQSDYAAGIEVDRASLELLRDGARVAEAERALDVGDGLLTGVVVGELRGLQAGTYRARMSLGRDGLERARGELVIDHSGGALAVTVRIDARCEGVECPMPGDDATLAQCRDGRCVDERCGPDTPDLCPDPTCAIDADCAASTACGQARCVAGGCQEVLDDEACAAGERCVRDVGCYPDGGTCASDLSCGLFDPTCLGGLARRCALFGLQDDRTAALVIYDPDTGASCAAATVDRFPGAFSGVPVLFGAGMALSSPAGDTCGTWEGSLDTGRGIAVPSPCGLPAPLADGSLAWVEQATDGEGILRRPGASDFRFSLPQGWGLLFGLRPGWIALQMRDDTLLPMDLSTGAIGAALPGPTRPQGVSQAGDGSLLYLVDEPELQVIHLGPDGTETRRVPLTGLPGLAFSAAYVGVGCVL